MTRVAYTCDGASYTIMQSCWLSCITVAMVFMTKREKFRYRGNVGRSDGDLADR